MQEAAPPPEDVVQLYVVDGNLGAMCTRDGPETVMLLSHEYVEEGLLGGRFRVAPRLRW